MEIKKLRVKKDNHPLVISSLWYNADITNDDKISNYILNKQKIMGEEEYYSKISQYT